MTSLPQSGCFRCKNYSPNKFYSLGGKSTHFKMVSNLEIKIFNENFYYYFSSVDIIIFWFFGENFFLFGARFNMILLKINISITYKDNFIIIFGIAAKLLKLKFHIKLKRISIYLYNRILFWIYILSMQINRFYECCTVLGAFT